MNPGYERMKERFGKEVADEMASIIKEGWERDDVEWTMQQLKVLYDKATRKH